MPGSPVYIIDDKTKIERVIYVILDAEPGTQFYIGTTLPHRMYKTYVEHACLRVAKTKDLFQRHIDFLTELYDKVLKDITKLLESV